MQNTERRALAEMDVPEPFWNPSDALPPELNWDPSDSSTELNFDQNDVPSEPNLPLQSNLSPINESSEPYWDSLSFEIVLEGLNPLLQINLQPLDKNNNQQLEESMNLT